MGKLLTIEQYIAATFEAESAPKYRTILSWIRSGYLKAKKIGRSYFIDPDDAIVTNEQPINNKEDIILPTHFSAGIADAINRARRTRDETTQKR